MNLKIQYDKIQTADGVYRVRAPGSVAASLWWGTEEGILPDWTAFAYLPLSANGVGSFRYFGDRAIPDSATHVIARAIAADCVSIQEISAPIPPEQKLQRMQATIRLCAASDLHFSRKAWPTKIALELGVPCDAILLAGDMTNDGTSEQLRMFYESIQTFAGDTHVFAVTGNHDIPLVPEEGTHDRFQYYDLQNALLQDAEARGLIITRSDSGAYAAKLSDIDIIGLNCVTDYRKFKFPEGQIEWLDEYLRESSDDGWRIILCHAPMIAHNPQRAPDRQPYLNKDIKLQRILDAHKKLIFLSGHTHFSPNDYAGCVRIDPERNNIYLNDGSVCPTTSRWCEPIIPGEWCDGIVTFISLNGNEIEFTAHSITSKKKISRGYYRYSAEKAE